MSPTRNNGRFAGFLLCGEPVERQRAGSLMDVFSSEFQVNRIRNSAVLKEVVRVRFYDPRGVLFEFNMACLSKGFADSRPVPRKKK